MSFEQPPIKEQPRSEKEEMADIMKAINNPESAIKMPDNVLELEKEEPENLNSPEEERKIEQGIKEAETLDDLINLFENAKGIMGSSEFFNSKGIIDQLKMARDINPDLVVGYMTRSLGLRDRVKEMVKTRKSPEEQAEINKIKEGIKANELDLTHSEAALERKKGSKKVEERIEYAKNKIKELKNDLDILEGKEINSLDNLGDKKITISKIKMKTEKGSEVQRGQEFSGFSLKEKITVNDIIGLEENGRLKIKTSPIESIKECSDGSYIIETKTSFYRLNIAA